MDNDGLVMKEFYGILYRDIEIIGKIDSCFDKSNKNKI
jgi:hypothetical protein